MSFIEESMVKDEKIYAQAKISALSQFGHIIIGFGCLLGIFFWAPVALLGILIWVWAYFNLNANELVVTNKQVIGKIGIISREIINLPLLRIESIDVDQTIMGRIFGYGTVTVSGSGGHMVSIPYIDNPLGFRRIFMQALTEHQDALQNQMAVYQQNIRNW